jgi:hypothetical protein
MKAKLERLLNEYRAWKNEAWWALYDEDDLEFGLLIFFPIFLLIFWNRYSDRFKFILVVSLLLVQPYFLLIVITFVIAIIGSLS